MKTPPLKSLLPALAVICLAGCAFSGNLHPVGARTPAGVPIGDYRLVNFAGVTEAQGQFEAGKLHGAWTFFDSHHTKLAEVTYAHGVAEGKFRTFYGSEVHPGSAGRLESEGEFRAGIAAGRHIAYDENGVVFADGVLGKGRVDSVTVGRADQVAGTATADVRFIEILQENVLASMR